MNRTIQTIHQVLCVFAIPVLLALTPGQASGKPTVTYIPDKEQVKEIVLENNSHRYTIAIDNAVKLVSILDKSSGYDYLVKNEKRNKVKKTEQGLIILPQQIVTKRLRKTSAG